MKEFQSILGTLIKVSAGCTLPQFFQLAGLHSLQGGLYEQQPLYHPSTGFSKT